MSSGRHFVALLPLTLLFASFQVDNVVGAASTATHRFHLHLLDEITGHFTDASLKYINNYLLELQPNVVYGSAQQSPLDDADDHALHRLRLHSQLNAASQLLEAKVRADTGAKERSLNDDGRRNVQFIRKIQQQLDQLHGEGIRDVHRARMYDVCKQFEETPSDSDAAYRALFGHVKLAPLATPPPPPSPPPTNVAAARSNFTTLEQFASQLYERVKWPGAEIIDDYLSVVRRLLIGVIEENLDNGRQPEYLGVLRAVDEALHVADFAQKRQRVYAYLQQKLDQNYETMQSAERRPVDLSELLKRLESHGPDMFAMFLFSNFEFLEMLHTEWRTLLASMHGPSADLQHLRAIDRLYNEFKQDPDADRPFKYDAYYANVRQLNDDAGPTAEGAASIFEILQDAAGSTGSSILAIIKSKCKEITHANEQRQR